MEDVVEKVKDRIISEGIYLHKVIIYCQYYREVAEMYQLFKKVLGIKFTHQKNSLTYQSTGWLICTLVQQNLQFEKKSYNTFRNLMATSVL